MSSQQSAQFPGLEIDEAVHIQRRTWAIQRVAWFALVAIVAAALAGLAGPGPLSATELEIAGGDMTLAYSRFGRYETRSTMRVFFTRAEGETVTIWMSNDYLEGVIVEAIFPEPESSRHERGGVALEFAVDRLNLTEGRPGVAFDVRLTCAGALHGRLGADPDKAVPFTQFVYP